MNDYRLETRKDNFRKCNFNIVERREKINMTLRKQKLEDMLMEKRTRHKIHNEVQMSLEIDPTQLKIETNFLKKITNVVI
jgi:hypothetical protein